MSSRTGAPRKERRWVFLAAVIKAGTFLVVAALIVPPWLRNLFPRWFLRGATVAFLWALLAVFLLTWALAPIIAAVALRRIRRAHRRGLPWSGAARALLLCGACFTGALFLELGAAARLAWSRRPPALPIPFATTTSPAPVLALPWGAFNPTPSVPFADEPDDLLDLVVIGESSARGEPYHPWLSVGQIVAWQLEQVFPGRRVRLTMRAAPGVCLEGALPGLNGLTHRPDAVLIYAGHNEFQARFGWARTVAHYVREAPPRPLAEVILETMSRFSALGRIIRRSLERHQLDVPPPPRVTRALVDMPSCTHEEYAALRADFRRDLEAAVRFCERVGALPILVIPPSNLGDYSPARSVMSATATATDRAAFARDFLAARFLELTDPARALAAYRALLVREPGFAEAHYRLARLLDAAGDSDQARHHYIQARDLDGLPMRCPSDFQAAYRAVAARHDVVLIDGPAVLAALTPRGILDDHVFHDAQHPNLRGYVALARAVLNRLHARRAFDWPDGRTAPGITPADCAAHFGLGPRAWSAVCTRTAIFFEGTAYIRYEPSGSLEKARRYHIEARRIAAGGNLDTTRMVSLGY